MSETPETLRARAHIIVNTGGFTFHGSIKERLEKLLTLSDVDLEVLFLQRACGQYEQHNAFDTVMLIMGYRLQARVPYLPDEALERMNRALEEKNWKSVIAQLIALVD